MSLVPNRAIEGAAGNQGYNIQRSLRFRSSASAYLSRTPASAGNRKTWTTSYWIKRGASGDGTGAYHYFLSNAGAGSNEVVDFYQNTIRVYFNGGAYLLQTTQVFRDYSGWYNIVLAVDTTQATDTNRVKLYINGSQVTAFSTAVYPPQNYDCATNNTVAQYIAYNGASAYYDGYLAEINHIDGQALAPSSFGQTDPATGVWVPKKYTGTYGTNGFYLPFSDNTSATTLAYDKSGNGNNWTPNNISTTAGATYDSMTDVPTLTSATAANYAVVNPLGATSGNVTIADGNLKATIGVSGQWRTIVGSMAIPASAGKWYWEATVLSGSIGSTGNGMVGIIKTTQSFSGNYYLGSDSSGYSYQSNANKLNNAVSTAYGASWTAGDTVGIAFDATTGSLEFFKNGTSQGTAFTATTGVDYFPAFGGATEIPVFAINFGQRPFSYTPPTGFKALNTFNLPDPTIKQPNQYMDATLWTGNNASRSIVNAAGFQPDYVWIKNRSDVTNHRNLDSVRGAGYALYSSSTIAEQNDTSYFTSFNSNGFSLGPDVGGAYNYSGNTYVGWQWKKGATPGFDIVTFTGDGSSPKNIAHSLGVAPKMIIIKSRNNVSGWNSYHASLGNTQQINLQSTAAASSSIDWWNNTSPTSSQFTIGANLNISGWTFVAYLFAEIAGFSKFGSYTGNGSADGPFVYCGFRPKYVMIKVASGATNDWCLYDTSRSQYNITNAVVAANSSQAESAFASGYNIDTVSNGFKVRDTTTAVNGSGNTLIFAAFAENPMKYSLAR